MMTSPNSRAQASRILKGNLRLRTDPSPPRPSWAYAAWGALLGLCLTLIVWAPAQWIAWGVTQASQDKVLWLNPRGTLWSGSAQMVLGGGAGSLNHQGLPGRIHWTISPSWTGLRLGLLADCCMQESIRMDLQMGILSLQIQTADHTSQWPAALLTGLGAPWNTLKPEGQLQLRTEAMRVQWTQGKVLMHGLAELQIKNLSSKLSTTKPIGTYQLQFRGPPEGTPTPSLQLTTLQGPLLLSGSGEWLNSRLRFTGEASAEEGHELALNNLLNILGRRQGPRSLLSLG